MEKNLSTFANEMASCAMILGLASSKSLVLIDELGRATSPKEGVGIVHAIAEELIKLKVKGLYTVNFNELTLCSASLSLLREIAHEFNSQIFTISQPLPRTLHYIIPTADCCIVSASVSLVSYE